MYYKFTTIVYSWEKRPASEDISLLTLPYLTIPYLTYLVKLSQFKLTSLLSLEGRIWYECIGL